MTSAVLHSGIAAGAAGLRRRPPRVPLLPACARRQEHAEPAAADREKLQQQGAGLLRRIPRPIVAGAVVAACAGLLLAGYERNHLDPHEPGLGESWFQGYYIRVTTTQQEAAAGLPQPQQPTSFALITGKMPQAPESWGNSSLVQLLLQYAGAPAPEVLADAQTPLDITLNGTPLARQPDLSTPPPSFQVSGEKLALNIEGDSCQITAAMPEGAKLSLTCTGPGRPWGPADEPPEGTVTWLPKPLVSLHWFVKSLSTPVDWTLERPGQQPLHGSGLAHIESNWGEGFPSCWHWAEGVVPSSGGKSSQAAFALAGGKLPTSLLPEWLKPRVFLLGVQTPQRSWTFRPQDPTIYSSSEDTCAGLFSIRAWQPLYGRAISVDLDAPSQSYSPLLCPTERGFVKDSVQSYSATATIRMFEYRLTWRGLQKELVETVVVPDAALEHGGECRCDPGQQS